MLYQSCDISAYHYNLVCYMLLMFMVTHIFAFVNIPHFFKNNFWPALVRLFNILLTSVFTWFLCKSRDVQGFPMDAASLAVFPVSCLINGSDGILGPSFFPRAIFHSSPT